MIDENRTGKDTTGVRVNRYLSEAGVCSRRQADALIAAGKVTIDGEIAVQGQRVSAGQLVCLNGKPVQKQPERVLIALNKPRGIVCTTDQIREKNNIIDFMHYPVRIYPVGRLDKDSEGLILLTNDGSLVNHILKSSMYHEKEYVVRVEKPVNAAFLKGMAGGVPLEEGVTRPCKVRKTGEKEFTIILTQGWNRQIRRMCRHFGYHVRTLKRVRIMNIVLGDLKTGAWRYVTQEELDILYTSFEKTEHSRRK